MLLLFLAGMLAAGVVVPAQVRQDGTWRPQVVILMAIDTLRADHLSCYGYPRPTSPFIDRVAREGVVFENVFSQANYTLASFASLHTGRYPLDIRDNEFQLPLRLPTLTSTLKSSGFRTAAFVGGGHLDHVFGFDRGFDIYRDRFPFGSFHHTAPPAFAWLEDVAKSNAPAFLFLHAYDIHDPYAKPLGFENLYDAAYPPNGVSREIVRSLDAYLLIHGNAFYQERHRRVVEGRARGEHLPPMRFEEMKRLHLSSVRLRAEDLAHMVAAYDGAISYADVYVGLLRETLESLGLADRTLLVLMGDHGEELLERGVAGHRHFLHDSELHVPLVFWGPAGLRGGRRVADVVELLDVMPTILDLVDVRSPASGQGVSRAGVLRGESSSVRPTGPRYEPVAVSAFKQFQSVRSSRYRLIELRKGFSASDEPAVVKEAGVGLFDTTSDPGERHDLSGRPEMKALRAQLHERLRERLDRGAL